MIKKISLLALFIAIIATSCNLGSRYRPEEGADQKAKVREVIQTSNYTYLRVEKNNQDQWIAVGEMDAKEGDNVYFEQGMEMKNFHSKELNRDFESILFVNEISDKPIKHGEAQEGMNMPPMGGGKNGSGMMGNKPEKPRLDKADVKVDQPAGGTSIGDIYSKKANLAGKKVTVRGQVTKVNAEIMGKNWIHIQDGTSEGKSFDLTVTTSDVPNVGDVVTYSGTIALDKDFGYGYFYDVLLEDAEVVK
jgi:hypothetical protein